MSTMVEKRKKIIGEEEFWCKSSDAYKLFDTNMLILP